MMEPTTGSNVRNHPIVMYIQDAPDERTKFKYAESSTSTISAGVGIDELDFASGGSIEVKTQSGAAAAGVLQGKKQRAFNLGKPVIMSRERHCVDVNPIVRARTGLPVNACAYVTQARWTGDLAQARTTPGSCWSQPKSRRQTFTKAHLSKTLTKDRGPRAGSGKRP